ncbi:hypothetical protein MHYP_G00091170 [Metynnis hypsauchen]
MIQQLKAENEALKRDLDALKTSAVSHIPKLLPTMERLDTWLETKGQSPQPQPSPSSIEETETTCLILRLYLGV